MYFYLISDQKMDSSENSRLKDTGQPSSSKTPANKARISQRNLFKHLHIHLDGPISSFNANQLPTAKHIIERYLWCTSSSDKKNIK